MAQQSGQVRFVRKGGCVYHPAECTLTFNQPPHNLTRPLFLGSEGGKSSFNTSLKYIKVGFWGAGSNHSDSASAQINDMGPEPPAPFC